MRLSLERLKKKYAYNYLVSNILFLYLRRLQS